MSFPNPIVVGSIVETASDGSIAIPNTTPPAVGDTLVACIAGYQSGGSRNIGSTPSGWTLLQSQSGDDNPFAMFIKVAEAADVIAANFPFSLSSNADVFAGAIIKLPNTALGAATPSEIDFGTTSYDFTTALTPETLESLILTFFTSGQNSSGGGTFTAFGGAPSLTWSVVISLQGSNGTPSLSFGIGAAQVTGLTQVTQRTASCSQAPTQAKSIAIMLNGKQNGLGTAALLVQAPTIFAPAGSAGVHATAALLVGSPVLFDANGDVDNTNWENTDKPAPGAIVNTDKP